MENVELMGLDFPAVKVVENGHEGVSIEDNGQVTREEVVFD